MRLALGVRELGAQGVTLINPGPVSPRAAHHMPGHAAQFVREFAKLGLTRTVGGVLGLALARELTPVVTSIILAGALPRSVCSGVPAATLRARHALY